MAEGGAKDDVFKSLPSRTLLPLFVVRKKSTDLPSSSTRLATGDRVAFVISDDREADAHRWIRERGFEFDSAPEAAE